MKSKLVWVLVGVGLGYVLAPQVSKIPFVNKLPQV